MEFQNTVKPFFYSAVQEHQQQKNKKAQPTTSLRGARGDILI